MKSRSPARLRRPVSGSDDASCSSQAASAVAPVGAMGSIAAISGIPPEPSPTVSSSTTFPAGELLAVHARWGAGPAEELTHDLVDGGGIIRGCGAGPAMPSLGDGQHPP
jgi:hypothetical protein